MVARQELPDTCDRSVVIPQTHFAADLGAEFVTIRTICHENRDAVCTAPGRVAEVCGATRPDPEPRTMLG